MALHDDDKPVGRILTRREILKLLSGGSAALVAGISLPKIAQAQSDTVTATATDLPTCVVKPELTEGPYFVDGQLNRFDIRIDPSDESIKEGMPLLLTYRISDVTNGTCAPLEGAQVDVWHCDADGVYSGVSDPGFDTSDQLWLRGYQVSDELGVAEFLTIVPGWYSGRAVHIHFKIRTTGADGEAYEFTSQFFFDPEQIEDLYAEEPYAVRGLPNTPNSNDSIYQGSDGMLTLELAPMSDEKREELGLDAGYVTTFDIGLDLSDANVGASDGASGGMGGPRGGRGRS